MDTDRGQRGQTGRSKCSRGDGGELISLGSFATKTGAHQALRLMSRMGHSSSRAAVLYRHATAERELAIAQRLSEMVVASRL